MRTCGILITALLLWPLLLGPMRPASAAPEKTPDWERVQRRAFDFLWNESDAQTGLTSDRARNVDSSAGTNTVASTASTGYALAALPIGVAHGWITNRQGYNRARLTLRFVHDKLPAVHGFYYHFVDRRTGERVWDSELSSIDTALLIMGARTAGDFWPGTEVRRLADDLTDRADWTWMQTDGGAKPQEPAPSMGWKPGSGFLSARWQGYSEAFYLYCLALGSRTHPLTPPTWDKWQIQQTTLEGDAVFGGAEPLFMAQMASGYLNVQGRHDRQGRDWWTAWRNATLADHAYCARNPENRKTYAEGFWGLNASDTPGGYGAARPADGQNDGTVSPTAMLASIVFAPAPADAALTNLWQKHHAQIWGRYGFSDAFNVDKNWYDQDVIGIDLGMMLLAVEDAHSGLIWRLMAQDSIMQRGLAAAGFTAEKTDAPAGRSKPR